MAYSAFLKKRANLLGVALVTGLTLSIGSFTFYLPIRQMERGQWVGHSRQVLDQLDTLESHITLFDHEKSLPPDPVRHFNMDLDHIGKLTSDNSEQSARIDTLRTKLKNKALVSDVLVTLNVMQVEERHLLDERTAIWHATMQRTRYTLAGSTLFLYVFILLSFLAMRKEAAYRRNLMQTEQRAAEQQREIAERLAQVVEIQHAVAMERMNLDALMQTICDRSQRVIGGDGGVVEMLDGEEMVYRAASGSMASFVGMRIKAQGSMSGLCMHNNTVLQCNDSEMDDRVDREACRKVGLRSMIVVPLVHRSRPVGVLKVTSAKPYAFHDEHVSTIEMMASVLSSTLSDAEANNALQQANKMLESLATTDGLTGLRNNRFFKERVAEEYSRSVRYKQPLSVVVLDVDHFKQFNDTFGHVAGDDVLVEVGQLMKRTARNTDCVARYGGEEFAIILPQTDAPGAIIIADRIREIIAGNLWVMRPITVSVGVSTITETTTEWGELVNQADQALYLSKSAGRNCVTHSDAACVIPSKKSAAH